ncbi:MAG: CsgG/HfaB family protein [Longimicrobiales bacterium]
MRSIRSAVTVGLLLMAHSLSAQTADSVQKCAKPLATIAVVEPQNVTVQSLSRYGLGSPTSLIRMMIQKSNCFTVLERGAGLANMQQERQMGRSGDLQSGSNMGGGQMLAADLLLTPNVNFQGNTGGAGGAVGGLMGGAVGGLLGGLKFKEASTSMLIGDMRTGVQVAAAEGKARKTDFNLAALGFGGGMLSAAGGYTNTPEGKVIAASFLDNYNKIVIAVRNDSTLLNRVAAAPAGPVYSEGDVIRPKIDNVKLLVKPNDTEGEIATLKKTDELVYLGVEKDGFLQVQGAAGSGWIKKLLITK